MQSFPSSVSTIRHWEVRKNFLIRFLLSGLLKNENCQDNHCHVTITSSISNGPLLFWQLRKEQIVIVFITKCDKMTYSMWAFFKKILQNLTSKEGFTNFKIIFTKSDKKLLQSVTGIAKCEKNVITKCSRHSKCDSYYKVTPSCNAYISFC